MRLTAVFLVLLAASLQAALMVQELVPWALADGGVGSFKVQAHVIEGDTAYITFSSGANSQIVRIDNLHGTQVRTQLVSGAQWTATTGASLINGAYGLGVVGDYLEMADSSSRAVWRIHKQTGTIASYVSYARLLQLTGKADALLTSANAVNPDSGEITYFEARTRSFVTTGGSNVVSYLITALEMTNLCGSSSVGDGATYDASQNFYWGNNDRDTIFMRTSTGTLQTSLSSNAIYAVVGTNLATFGALHYLANNNLLYFMERSSGAIMAYEPGAADPGSTLQVFVDRDTLTNSVCGTSNLGCIKSDSAYLTFNNLNNDSNSNCLYRVIPEPAALALGLLLLCVRSV